jgi:hypothetical protein
MICEESAHALIDALIKTNERLYPFVGESYELMVQYEENEELIRMVEVEMDD